ncbi:hypothetical protein [Chitinivibrio alkaliphilus]|uniref:DUF3899 domain-containing protein n=1 Tax=Chitinivibrio alkaliphilus ACht1 TaxID=1313304 RepID=U7D9A7_9BACT|nr:hypothetical protein [Chitinivibrio alkaliphilus]ERP32166.1 hypothetical protein CALK_0895 [Chitinivibrio alkaliphilus ACht1]
MKKRNVLYLIGLLFLSVGVVWYGGTNRSLLAFCDTLFAGAMITLLFGLILVIINSSRLHYYKYITEKFRRKKGAESAESFEKSEARRFSYVVYGVYFAAAGVLGVAVCAYLTVHYSL